MQWAVARKEFITSRSKVVNTKATTYFFYIPTILINIFPGTQWVRDMELGSKHWLNNEILHQFYSNNFNSLKGSIFLECFKLPMPLVVGRL